MAEFDLVTGVVYGPVQSRRLGASLGINPLPSGVKACGFNCNYCQLGWTYELVEESLSKHPWPTAAEIAAGLEARLRELKGQGVTVDSITFAGNGEPTLHPDFDGVVTEVLAVRDREASGVEVGILTNGALLHDHPRVVGGCNLLDERYVKLDGGTDAVFLEMNSPTFDINVWKIIQGAKRLRDCVVQAMFTRGRRDNTKEKDVADWVRAVGQINPKSVQIYTVSRTPADNRIAECPRARLEEIAALLKRETGIEGEVY
jgi:wyosine [tRNA(Phe)-imidazoG37] synthetase (radical SAM superfamily)